MTLPAAPDEGQREAGEQADEARLRLRRGRLVTAVVAGVVVLALGVVTLLGGFRQRTDLLTRVPAGSTITTGPYAVTFAKATVQRRTDPDEWDVVVSGSARTTGTTSIAPPSGDSGFLFARSAAGGEVVSSRSIALGDAAAFESQETLTPGLPPVRWSVTFRYVADPREQLLLAVYDQEYRTAYLFGDEKSWVTTNHASTTVLPLERLPDTTY